MAAEQAVEQDPDEDHDAGDDEVARRRVGDVDGPLRGVGGAGRRGGRTRRGVRSRRRRGCSGGGGSGGRRGSAPLRRLRLGFGSGSSAPARRRSRLVVVASGLGLSARLGSGSGSGAALRLRLGLGPARRSRLGRRGVGLRLGPPASARRIRPSRRSRRARSAPRARRAPPPACRRVVRSFGRVTPGGRLDHRARRGRQCTEGAEPSSVPSPIRHRAPPGSAGRPARPPTVTSPKTAMTGPGPNELRRRPTRAASRSSSSRTRARTGSPTTRPISSGGVRSWKSVWLGMMKTMFATPCPNARPDRHARLPVSANRKIRTPHSRVAER